MPLSVKTGAILVDLVRKLHKPLRFIQPEHSLLLGRKLATSFARSRFFDYICTKLNNKTDQ